ncbi:LacI family DNA-binding transcriptional regulator [Nocardioides eburneiflavus]|uniref:LacI family DNA-binding transcriptional regulator n=1 Tax=Nocardioides eburneiflavus TaxID=2518372 RepID=UPI002482713B|nr:LacI family DNA-binding transcriptional regulator [Nocardioides eburneiflavus]
MSAGAGRATITDVALRAGVSRTTVSHAMNGKGTVSPATSERVRAVAAELGYEPNAVARGLRQSRLGVIALIIRPLDSLDTANPEGVDYFLRFAGSAALSAVDRGYGLLLASDPTRDDAPAPGPAADGFIVDSPVEDDPLIALLRRRGTPYVAVGVAPDSSDDTPAVTHDAEADTDRILAHLTAGGARRIALVTGTDRNDWNRVAHAAYVAWVQRHGHLVDVHALDESSGVAGGRALGLDLLSGKLDGQSGRGGRPDAVYCLTGRHAAGVADAAKELSLRIPDDVQVVAGSDAVMCRTSEPPITALDLNPEQNARTAVNALVAALSGQPPRWPLRGAENHLIVRESTSARR